MSVYMNATQAIHPNLSERHNVITNNRNNRHMIDTVFHTGTDLVDLQGLFEPIRGLIDLTSISSHAAQSQITCPQEHRDVCYCTNILFLLKKYSTYAQI